MAGRDDMAQEEADSADERVTEAADDVVNYYPYYGKKIDSEPGRCQRTDGKKWRCSKDAHPDPKYYLLVGSTLVDLFLKISREEYAVKVFYRFPERDTVLCNTMISGLMKDSRFQDSIS
ncbi:hypothetical protein Tsubulata_023526 [Turnera subulata]|uniref:Growth-regulating factor n=1 Tax=Turnera subulata TaxID=218843 RepID=A0A9Q0GDA0_9ROSI|nr:hypothetical protein Tsubulata_023526 [Turnera subulata]